MSNLPSAIEYLPKKLRSKPLNVRIATLLDYVREKHYESLIQHPSGKWDPDSPAYNANKIIDELNGASYLKYLSDEESKVTMSRILSGLYKIKGTKRALSMILALVGVRGQVVDYFKLQRELRLDTQQSKIWVTGAEGELQPCEIMVTIEIEIQTRFSVSQETLLRDLVETFLWSCTKLAAFLVVRYLTDATMEDVETKEITNTVEVIKNDPMAPLYATYNSGISYTTSGAQHSGIASNAGIPDMYDTVKINTETG